VFNASADVKNMITGAAQMDGACLKVVPAAKKKVVAREFYDEYEY